MQISNDKCDQGEIISTINRKFQVYPEVILCQSFIKNDRFELILEKSSELGVNRIIPMITERVQGGSKLKTSDDKLLRWRKIIKEAVEQSGGNVIPKLESFATFKDLLESLDKKSEKILFWEKSVNSIEFNLNSRTPNPNRLITAYHQSASTMNLIRSLIMQGYTDINQIKSWEKIFLQNSLMEKKY